MPCGSSSDFIDRIAATGMTDCNVGFYMALPGTELFNSLYDAGQVRVDRAYFRHILSAQQLVSTQSYCRALGVGALTGWKLRLLGSFYSRRGRLAAHGGLVASLRRGLSGLSQAGAHASKLQTAFRVALRSARDTLRTRVGAAWMSRAEERRFFAGWDEIYREVRRRNLEAGSDVAAPADTRELHRASVIAPLRRVHGTRRVLAG